MTKTATHLLTAAALITGLHAGESYSAKSSKAVLPPPPAPLCQWGWFAGASGGQLLDAEEQMYTLHFGAERFCEGDPATHAIFLEVGYADIDTSTGYTPGTANYPYDVDGEIIPITINYKYERNLSGALNWYAGAGAGLALVDADFAILGDPIGSFDDTVFYGHIFAGLSYNFSAAFEVYGGARYIFMDDPDLTGISAVDEAMSLDGDVLLELGARYNF
ncbi:MAG: outer membrane protein [Verrucomicrobiales bacterium]